MTERFITVIGIPGPQGSKSFKGLSKAGHAILVESSKKVRTWRESVKWAVVDSGGAQTITGPIDIEMYFTLPKPKSAPKSRRTWPDRKPDLSKLVRSTEDALTDSGAFEDDARIVRCISMKVFPGEHANALAVPGVVIRIRSAA